MDLTSHIQNLVQIFFSFGHLFFVIAINRVRNVAALVLKAIHGFAVDSNCEQYSYKFRKYYVVQRFS